MPFSATETNPLTVQSQVADGITTPSNKWFSLQDNLLDGTYHPMDAALVSETGWWGTSLSDASGNLSASPAITYSINASIHTIVVTGDSLLNEYPVDFTMKLYNGATLLYTHTVTGNNSVSYSVALGIVYDVTSMVLTVTKVNKVSRSVKILESYTLTDTFTSSDSLKPKIGSDIGALSSGIFSTDILKPKSTDISTPVINRLMTVDSLTPMTTDVITNTKVTLYSIDSILYKTTDINVITNRLGSADALKVAPSFIETALITNKLNTNDILLYKISSDISVVTNRLNSIDLLKPKSIDTSFFTQYEIWSNDLLKPKTTDVSTPVSASIHSTDAIKALTSYTKVMTISLYGTDGIIASGTIEVDDVLADLYSVDSIKYLLNEVGLLTNVHTVMDASNRQVFAKIEITYSSPFVDADITVTANQVAYNTNPQQTADSISTPAYKWFGLSNNKLDGTFHPMDASSSVGWWGTSISDSSGILATAAQLTIAFGARPIYSILVTGDSLLNQYPVDFTVKLYDVSNTLLYTQTVVGNTQVSYLASITPINDVCSMVLNVTKVNSVGVPCTIVEFYTAVKETYLNDDIISIHLLEEQVYDNQSLPIGNVSSNEVDIRLVNPEGKFDPGNSSSLLKNLMKRNRRVQVWLGAYIIPNTIEWYPMGTFWTLDWKPPRSEMYLDISARDELELMRLTDYVTSPVFVNQSVAYIAEAILADYGMTSSDYSIDSALGSIIIPYAWFDIMSHRAALTSLVEASLARCYCDRDGLLIITSFVPATVPMYEYTNDASIITMDNPLQWSQITNYVEVTVSPRSVDVSAEIYSDSIGFNVPASTSVLQTLSFNTIPCINVVLPTFTAAATVTITSSNIYAWGMDVTFTNSDTVDHTVTNISISGQPLIVKGGGIVASSDSTNVRDNGKQKYSLSNDFIQSTTTAKNIADTILATYKDPRHDATLETRGNIALRLGDRVQAPNYDSSTTDYFVVRQDLTWDGGLSVTVDAQRIGS